MPPQQAPDERAGAVAVRADQLPGLEAPQVVGELGGGRVAVAPGRAPSPCATIAARSGGTPGSLGERSLGRLARDLREDLRARSCRRTAAAPASTW